MDLKLPSIAVHRQCPDSPIYDKWVLQVQERSRWKNMGVLHSDAAYMPIGTQFIANINFSGTKKDADIVL